MGNSKWYWHGGGTRAASRIRFESETDASTEGNAKEALLDVLPHGQIYGVWIEKTFSNRRQVDIITTTVLVTSTSSITCGRRVLSKWVEFTVPLRIWEEEPRKQWNAD